MADKKLTPAQAAKEAEKAVKKLMAECSGTELQKLKAFGKVITAMDAKIGARLEELEPDTWGL